MQKYVIIFWTMTLVLLGIPPAINAIFNLNPLRYSVEFLMPTVGKLTAPLGVSIAPGDVIVGRDGWLFLGDRYESTISSRMAGITPAVERRATEIREASVNAEKYFASKGVKAYLTLIGPDKASVYPEMLPGWAVPAAKSPVDALAKHVANVVDPRALLIKARYETVYPIYYRTDSHWTSYGARLAFDALMARLKLADGELVEPTFSQPEIIDWSGGDLAGFLRVREVLKDRDAIVKPAVDCNIETIDYATGNVLWRGVNKELSSSFKPLLVRSDKAVNKRRVLWLRDSFGSAMSPFIASAFSDVVQVHFGKTTPESIDKLVEQFVPELVIMTVAERSALSDWFTEASGQ